MLPFLPFETDLRHGLGLEHLITGIKMELTPLAKRRRLDDRKAFCALGRQLEDRQLLHVTKILERILKARVVEGSSGGQGLLGTY